MTEVGECLSWRGLDLLRNRNLESARIALAAAKRTKAEDLPLLELARRPFPEFPLNH